MKRSKRQPESQLAPVGAIEDVLNACYASAEAHFLTNKPIEGISPEFLADLAVLSEASSKASTAFTNVITSLAIKVMNEAIDIRFHQVQIGAPFNFRRVSEIDVFPWLSRHSFEGAMSGWQTRTFERPKPYMLDFDENIGQVKDEFLRTFNFVEEEKESATLALTFLLYEQFKLRELKKVPLASPSIDNIQQIVTFFHEHFVAKYSGKGASRLPVLAIYALYSIMMTQLSRYSGMLLRQLESHSSADSQTGAVGDIEVEISDGHVLFEALEIKHLQVVTGDMVDAVAKKIAPHRLDRYYLLTTHEDCRPDEDVLRQTEQIRARLGCQVIVNGIMPTLRYYLRLLEDPAAIFPVYAKLLNEDRAITHQHRVAWTEIVTRTK